MNVPNTYTDLNETGCCAVPNIIEWDEKEVTFENKRFIRMYTRSFLFIPLNMAKIMTRLHQTVEGADAATTPQEAMILSRELSPWKAEQLYAVSKEVEGADNVLLEGTYLTKVFEGPYKDAGKWHQKLLEYVKARGKIADKTYFFYTTCPKCAEYYEKNYTIGLAHVG